MRYTVHFAHADVRETGGELTEETPKGWGQVEIDVDHEIVTQEDKDEVTKQIARNELREDGAPRYTHLAVQVITKHENEVIEVESSSALAPLTEKDFEFRWSADKIFKGTPIGEDDFFIFYGHDISEQDALTEIVDYFEVVGADFSESELDEYIFSRKIDRTWAKQLGETIDSGEWMITWNNVSESESGAFPVTVITLQ